MVSFLYDLGSIAICVFILSSMFLTGLMVRFMNIQNDVLLMCSWLLFSPLSLFQFSSGSCTRSEGMLKKRRRGGVPEFVSDRNEHHWNDYSKRTEPDTAK